MDYTGFLQRLLEDMENPTQSGERRILTFRNPRHYHECQQQLEHIQMTQPETPYVPTSHLLHAFMIPLPRDSKLITRYQDELAEEQDVPVKVHTLANKAINSPGIPYGVKQIQAPKAWSTSTGHQIKIGVIDTGVDYYHPDLRHSLGRGINLLNRSMLPLDDNGHGTHIAGTIAAANSTEGMIGVAPRATVYPVKAFDINAPPMSPILFLALIGAYGTECRLSI